MKKRIVVTGVSGGLGGYIAGQAFAGGYDVVGLARKEPEENPGFPVLLADVRDPDAVARAFGELRGRPLWGVINAAGVAAMNLLVTTPPATMREVIAANLLGAMYCCAEASRLLIRGRAGRIINISSIAAALSPAGESAYAASKAGVETFSRCIARELAPFGVTVNCVAPGPVDTKLLRGLSPDQINAVVHRQIIARMGTAEDVWNTTAWLLSEESSMISGETLHIGGV